MLYLIDHNEPKWNRRYHNSKRENGAHTYSKEIVKFQVPLWSKHSPGDMLISTCPLLSDVDDLPEEVDLVVQYLHTMKYDDPAKEAKEVIKNIKVKYKAIVFVTAYTAVQDALDKEGIQSIFIPMTIDVSRLPKPKPIYDGKKIIYFGNVLHHKRKAYRQLVKEFKDNGWEVDVLSRNTYKGEKIDSQEEIWKIVSRYRYGIGVGRCALEMSAMGMKVFVGGIHENEGGAMLKPGDKLDQALTNYNGLNIKHSHQESIDGLSMSYGLRGDIRGYMPIMDVEIGVIVRRVMNGGQLE